MFRAASWYLRKEVAVRASAIIRGPELWVSVGAGVAVALWGKNIHLGQDKVGDIVTALLTYAAIALGFCLSGLTVALTLPDSEFTKHLATMKPENAKHDSYSDLMFVFSWTALIHWVDVVIAILILVLAGPDEKILPSGSGWVRSAILGGVVFSSVYGVCQFMITVITLAQVGNAYVFRLSQRKP